MEPSKRLDSGQADVRGANDSGDIARAAGLLGGLTLVSRVAGLARDVVIGSLFGASPAADAFFVAFRIPNLFRRIVGEGAASTAFVPVFTSRLVEGGRGAALRAALAVGVAAAIILALIVSAGMLFADPIVSLFAPGFVTDPEKRALTVSLTAATFPYLALVGMAAWAMGTLHTFRRFTAPALGPILLNVAIIVSALLLHGRLNTPVFALVVGVLLGGALQFLVQVPALRAEGLASSTSWRLRDPAVARVGALLAPTILGAGVYQINILVATILASLLPGSSVSYLWYAGRIFEFPLGIVAVAIGTAALPVLSAQASAGRLDDMANNVSYALRSVWVLCIPAAVGLWMLAPEIVSLLFERGAFRAEDVVMTAWALRAYVFGLLGVAAVRVLSAVFYAFEQPRVPVVAACVALAVNAFCDLALMGPTDAGARWWAASAVASMSEALRVADLRHAGLAWAASIAATVNALLLLVAARRRLPSLAISAMARSVGLHCVAAGAMAAVLWGWQQAASSIAVWLHVAGGIALAAVVYVACAKLLGSQEIDSAISALGVGRNRR